MKGIDWLNLFLVVTNLILWGPVWVRERKQGRFVRWVGGFVLFIWAPLTILSILF